MMTTNLSSVLEIPGSGLADNQVHIWQVSLDQPVSRFYPLVSPDERNRAAPFHFERDRNRFIIRRGILRVILGSYLKVEPGAIRYHYGVNNKPSLAEIDNNDNLHFSVSHSGGRALYALSRGCEIGVDIEYVRDIPEMEQLLEQVLSPQESEGFNALTGPEKREGFFSGWTRKEAFLKATGDGLSRSLKDIEISPAVSDGENGMAARTVPFKSTHFFVYDIEAGEGYKAAFAREEPCRDLACFQW